MKACENAAEGEEFSMPNTCANHVVIDCTCMIFVDAVGVSTLQQVSFRL